MGRLSPLSVHRWPELCPHSHVTHPWRQTGLSVRCREATGCQVCAVSPALGTSSRRPAFPHQQLRGNSWFVHHVSSTEGLSHLTQDCDDGPSAELKSSGSSTWGPLPISPHPSSPRRLSEAQEPGSPCAWGGWMRGWGGEGRAAIPADRSRSWTPLRFPKTGWGQSQNETLDRGCLLSAGARTSEHLP